MKLAEFGVRTPVVANLTMWVIIGAGLIFGITLRREFFPEVRANQITINAPYPGASPEEVESSLAIKIEDQVADLDGIDEIQTSVREGFCSVRIEYVDGFPIDQALADVKREVDALQDLPPEVDEIVVDKFEPNIPAINVSLFGDADEEILKEAIKEVRDDLRKLPGMGDVVLGGVRKDEIRVEIPESALLEHGLSLPAISERVRQALVELPSGSVRSNTNNITVRTLGKEEQVAEIRNIVIKGLPNGQVLKIGDIATIRDTFADVDLLQRLNGKPAASLTVYKVGKDDAVEMAEMVKAYVAGRRGEPIERTTMEKITRSIREFDPRYDGTPVSRRLVAYELGQSKPAAPPGELVTTTDLARFIVGRLDLLSRNAFWGGILVFFTLVILLNARVAFWVSLGVVVALLGTLAFMHFVGITLNLLTMFGLIVVIGILVDDGIVIAENITAKHEAGMNPKDAAVEGCRQVAWPVIGTILTTIVAFMPLALIEGRIGDLIGVLPAVVVCALTVSLLEVLFILPNHMAHSLADLDERHEPGHANWLQRLEFRFDAARERFFQQLLIPAYVKVARACMHQRYITLACAIAVSTFFAGIVMGGRVPFVFIDSADSETVSVSLRMPTGTPIERTDEVIRKIEDAALSQEEVQAAWALIGSAGSLDGESSSQQAHVGQVILELKPVELRDKPSGEVIQSIYAELGSITGIKSLRIEEIGGGPEGPPISLTVASDSESQIMPVVREVRALLAEYDGVIQIADDSEQGQRELRIELLDSAAPLGFTPESLARQMRAAVFGLESHTFAGDQEDVDVRVTLPAETRRSLASIEALHVFSPDGVPVPLGEVAKISDGRGYASVQRLDRQRAVTITADYDRSRNPGTSVEDIVRELKSELEALELASPGVSILERGRQQDVSDSFRTLPIGLITAIGLNFVILAWLFGSYLQPLIILTAVPFTISGVVIGHMLLGFDLTFLSLIGFIALTGVVVNDSIVFMKFYNEQHAAGVPIFNALLEAGRQRFRPILLTTVTTVLGLLPLLAEQSFQARFLIPMAITITFGLMSATFLILIALPCLILVFADVKHYVRQFWNIGLDPWERHAHHYHPETNGTPATPAAKADA